jgi:integrase/recombinase XerC
MDAPAGNYLFLRYVNHLRTAKQADGTKYSSNAIKSKLTALRSFLKLCKSVGWVNWSIEASDGVRRVAHRDTRGPGEEGFRKIVNAITGHKAIDVRDRAMIWMLFSPALRREEVVDIDLADLDLDHPDGPRMLVKQKMENEEKVWVSLPDETVALVREWIGRRPEGAAPGPLFTALDRRCREMGMRMDGGSVWRMVQKRGNAVDIDVSPHKFRHAAGTHALDITNGDVRAVQKFMRHKRPDTVLIYDDNRRNLKGEIAGQVASSSAKNL